MKDLRLLAFVALLLCLPAAYADDPAAPLPESKTNDFGYPSVAAARKALLARKDAQSHVEDGWLVVEVPSQYAMYTFAPQGDPAYPAVVKRVITQDPSKYFYINMSVLCEASKQACDNLVRNFQALNKQIEASLNQH